MKLGNKVGPHPCDDLDNFVQRPSITQYVNALKNYFH